jgi:hypothetical protein
VAFTKLLIMYKNVNPPLPPLSFIPPYPILGTVSTGIIFAFTYMCIHYSHCIHPPTLFLPNTYHRCRTCSTLFFSDFVPEKR